MTFRHRLPTASRSQRKAALRVAGCIGAVGLLSACAGGGQHISASQEAAQYSQRAHRTYAPPGPAGDPWGPYIREASSKYDVPERWIREVMRVESGGHTELNGIPITSGAGAMGLMQVMPATYDELRGRYTELGDDPYDPRNSIFAGAAYIRELYDLYGNPGFLAAYNGGPGRLDDYLTRNRPLPDETRRYVAKIGPYIIDSFPSRRSTAEMYAMNSVGSAPPPPASSVPVSAPPAALPVQSPPVEVAYAPPSSSDGAFDPPPGWTPRNMPSRERSAYVPPPATPAPPPPAPVAMASNIAPPRFEPAPVPGRATDALPEPRPVYVPDEPAPAPRRAPEPRQTQVAALPEPPPPPPSRTTLPEPPLPSVQMAAAYGSEPRHQGFRFVGPAYAAPAPAYRGEPGSWAIQVGAFGNEELARSAVGSAREQAGSVLSGARPAVASVHEQRGVLYRARLTGLSRDAAAAACERLRGRTNCIVLSPDSQS